MNAKSQLAMDKYNWTMSQLIARDDYRRLSRLVTTEFTGRAQKPFYMDVTIEEHEVTRVMNCAIDAAMAVCGHTAFNEQAALLYAYLPLHSPDAIAALDKWLRNFKRAW